MSDDTAALLAQEAQARLDRAATYLPDCSPWLAVSEAAGSWVYDITGARYLDFGEGARIAVLGHGYVSPVSAISEHLQHYLYPGSPAEVAAVYTARYARKLSDHFPVVGGHPQQVLPCASVSEARLVVSQLTAVCPGVEIRPISADHALSNDMVQDLVQQARATGKVIVADETVSGFGRTGTFLAIQHYGITPDITILGPSGGGGVPFAAVVAPQALFRLVSGLGPVFTSPVSCAAAYGVLTGMVPALYEHVTEMGALLQSSVQELTDQFPDTIADLTGVGLLRQLHLADPTRADEFRLACRQRGLILGPGLTLTPPLTVTDEEVVAAADIMADVLLEWSTP